MADSKIRRSRDRQCDFRRAGADRRGISRPPRHDQGRHGADRRGPRRRDLPATWGRRPRCPAARPPTPSSAIANFGARAAYVGKVKDDQIGRLYTHDIRAAGVAFETKPAADGPATGCSYILVTPDGERTMNTYLGAAQELTPGRYRRRRDRGRPASSISKAISGIPRTPRKPSSRRRRSRTAPAARSR